MTAPAITPVFDSTATTVRINDLEGIQGARVIQYNDGSAVLLGPRMVAEIPRRMTDTQIVVDAAGYHVTGTNAAGERETWHSAPLPAGGRRGCGCGS